MNIGKKNSIMYFEEFPKAKLFNTTQKFFKTAQTLYKPEHDYLIIDISV